MLSYVFFIPYGHGKLDPKFVHGRRQNRALIFAELYGPGRPVAQHMCESRANNSR